MSFLKRLSGKKKGDGSDGVVPVGGVSSKQSSLKESPADAPADEETKRRDRNLSISRSGRHKVKRTQRSSVLEKEFYSSPETSPTSCNPPSSSSAPASHADGAAGKASARSPSSSSSSSSSKAASTPKSVAASFAPPKAVSPSSLATRTETAKSVSSSAASSSSQPPRKEGGGSCRDKSGNALINASKTMPSQATAV